MGREAWIQALNGANLKRWDKARNYAIYYAVKTGGRGVSEQLAKTHNISRQRIAEIVVLTERRIENGDYDDFQAHKLQSFQQELQAKTRSHLESRPKDLD